MLMGVLMDLKFNFSEYSITMYVSL
jgi:hypothetical protein